MIYRSAIITKILASNRHRDSYYNIYIDCKEIILSNTLHTVGLYAI